MLLARETKHKILAVISGGVGEGKSTTLFNLAQRLAFFALPDAARVTLGETAVQFLYDTFGQNLREAEYFLYEVWQRQEAVGEITGAQLAAMFQSMAG